MSRLVLAELPPLWVSVRIGDLADIAYGKGLREDERTGYGEVNVYGSGGVVGQHDEALHPGPSIIIGRKGSVGSVYYEPAPFWCIDTAFYLENISEAVDIEYLAYILDFINLPRLSITVGVPGINRTDLGNEKVPVPPLPEQARIVTILRQADELRRLRQQARAQADKLLASIFHEMFGDPTVNPQNWPTKKLSSLCVIRGGGTPSKSRSDYWNGIIPWVSPKDMIASFISESEDHISEAAVKESATNLVPEGAVLVVTRSGILKHTLPLALTETKLAINQDLKAFIPKDHSNLNGLFLLAQLQSRTFEILQRVRVGATVHNIATSVFSELELISPDISLQEEFANRVITLRETLKEQSESQEKFEALFRGLLAQAFSGELTVDYRQQHQAELQAAAVKRNIALGLRGKEPHLIDFREGRVTPEEEAEFRRRINLMMKAVAQEITESLSVTQDILTLFTSQYQSALTDMAGIVIRALPTYENLVDSALRESVASLNDATKLALASAFDVSVNFQPLADAVQQSWEVFNQSLGYTTLAIADEQVRRAPPKVLPQLQRAIHSELDSTVSTILQAAQAQSVYFTSAQVHQSPVLGQERADLVQIEAALELLETAGFMRQVVVGDRPVYRLVEPIEDGALLPEEIA